MREIMYRGIPKEKFDGYAFSKIWSDNCDGSFVYGSLLISKGKYYICASSIFKINCCINNAMMSVIEVIPESVGQYTGLTDKNGKKIFEGDIHEFICDEGGRHLFVVRFGEYNDFESDGERYGLYFQNIRTGDCNSFYGNEKDYANIIGNIHDNPELLKGGDVVCI